MSTIVLTSRCLAYTGDVDSELILANRKMVLSDKHEQQLLAKYGGK